MRKKKDRKLSRDRHKNTEKRKRNIEKGDERERRIRKTGWGFK